MHRANSSWGTTKLGWESSLWIFHWDLYPLVIRHSYWKWPFIVSFPFKIVIFHSFFCMFTRGYPWCLGLDSHDVWMTINHKKHIHLFWPWHCHGSHGQSSAKRGPQGPVAQVQTASDLRLKLSAKPHFGAGFGALAQRHLDGGCRRIKDTCGVYPS